jgi:hypothetical protein
MPQSEFDNLKKQVFAIASLIDSQLRVSAMSVDLDDIQTDFLDNWLKTGEVDPILGSVIAQLLGLREMPEPEEGDNDAS